MKRLFLGMLPILAMTLATGPKIGPLSVKAPPTPPEPEPTPPPVEESPVVKSHSLPIGDRHIEYYSTCGMMPIKNEDGEIEANFFFTAYTLGSAEGDRRRPLMFSFNGGPGSSSVWLHLGGLGPKRVRMLDDGAMPQPPFETIDNEHSWLEETDLVFIDPVDTGYSRATTPELAKKFRGVQPDLDSVGEFIRLYLSRYKRWSSPLFLVGESYGTFRAAGLAGLLIEKGIAFNGIVLVSSVLNMQTLRFDEGNDLPYALYLPTYAATAWYHKRLPADLQARTLESLVDEVEKWTAKEYTLALAKGAGLQGDERAAIVKTLARYTGLSERYVDQSNVRIHIQRFCKELLRDEAKTVGRLDSRYTGFDAVGVSEMPDYDPSMSAIRPPFTSALNDHIRATLGYETDAQYHILRGVEWNWGDAAEGYSKTSAALSSAFAKNPYLHLFVASGYYDLATCYFATDYTLDHLALDPGTRGNLRTEKYPVGHMVYLEKTVLEKLQKDVASFIKTALTPVEKGLRS